LFLCRSQNKGRTGERSDIFKDSLSEGLKAEKSSSDEGEEIGDINIEEDEDEEQIIQKRRKQREELLKVNIGSLALSASRDNVVTGYIPYVFTYVLNKS
jgi:serine/threonine-protein kinase PRP4